ncbi:unnamed protein product [Microthlaspi erraticum]|uniref:Uncharacterized protein n=1 Tax=Microthlaspi erraticum TaxID=1685480 RepID=A0A6D2IIP0_9BRAS|nr:unnamed protein product [Microthlaspi erraticum]
MNVYLVQGLKSNLISVSQLCDEGLTVWFNKIECKAIDSDGKTVYEEFVQATTATCGINLQEIVRGVPKLKGTEKLVCGPCNQGKQIKVQHKKVADVQSKTVLD